MTCEVVRIGGAVAIVCSRGVRPKPCSACGKPATRECDWKVASRKSGTCDRALCDRCTFEPAPEKDLCRAHAAVWKARGRPAAAVEGEPAQPDLFAALPPTDPEALHG